MNEVFSFARISPTEMNRLMSTREYGEENSEEGRRGEARRGEFVGYARAKERNFARRKEYPQFHQLLVPSTRRRVIRQNAVDR